LTGLLACGSRQQDETAQYKRLQHATTRYNTFSHCILCNSYGDSLPLIRRGSMSSGLLKAAFIPDWKSVIELRNKLRLTIIVPVWLAIIATSTVCRALCFRDHRELAM
jgi:hypothetical protein